MPVSLVVGAQWGDEGKGRIVDFLSLVSDAVARFGGGANAGHTVIVADKTFKLRIVPSGVIAGVDACIIGPGTVVSPSGLITELDLLASAGVDVTRVWLSDLAHLLLPYHKELDRIAESERGEDRLGTTGNGIGPAYVDRVARTGIRAGDLRRPGACRRAIVARSRVLETQGIRVDTEATCDELTAQAQRLLPHIRDTVSLLHEMLRAGKRVLAEGAQGTMLDVGLGTYPYVTSSTTVAGGAGAGLGLGPTQFEHVIGVTKAYSTRVGGGPLPTELTGAAGDRLRELGAEFGVVTGRPRRCGWLDLAALRYAVTINGVTHLALTKLDVLDDFESIGVCREYAGRGDESLPLSIDEGATAITNMIPGWRTPTTGARAWEDLPRQARDFISLIEMEVGAPVAYVSVGPERSQIIVRPGAPLAPAAVAS